MEAQTVKVLDQNTANKIAAGEVVEKPASVVKELVENSLDAGATMIEVYIVEGGTEYIRVVDNGCGMDKENAALAISRHATSKLRSAEDLLTLGTLGFRGEALPSIASVSKFTLLTRTVSSDIAVSVQLEGGENLQVTETGASVGTSIVVEDLFYNVPARRKFLKTPMTEGRYIKELLERLALSRPDVCFKLSSNNKEVLHTPGDGNLLVAIRSIYGKSVAEELLPVNFHDGRVKITGFISKPTLLKGTRQQQTLFVNGRTIGNKMLSKAIDHAYQSQIPKNGFPYVVLNIEVDTRTVDVNVHPQKSEVKFSDDSLMYKAMFKALTDTLTRPMQAAPTKVSLLPDSELNVFQKPVQPSFSSGTTATGSVRKEEQRQASRVEEPFRQLFRSEVGDIFRKPEEESNFAPPVELKPQEPVPPREETEQQSIWSVENTHPQAAKPYAEPASSSGVQEEPAAASTSFKDGTGYSNEGGMGNNLIQEQSGAPQTLSFTDTTAVTATVWPIGQVDKTFIIAQSEDTLYLIDQHAAHERILFDKLMAAHTDIPAQQLLIPLYITLPADELPYFEAQHDEFLRLGVDATPAGENLLRVSSLPADLAAEDAEDFLQEIAHMLKENRELDGSTLRQEILHTTACKAAIKAGQLLNMRQMRQLLVDLFNTEHPFTCPHGRPCMIEFDADKLYKLFKRTGF